MTLNLNPQELQTLAELLYNGLLPVFEKRAQEQAKIVKRELHCLTVADVAQRLKWSEKTVLSRIEAGALKAANIGSWERPAYRVSEADLTDFYQRHRAGK
ncbi:DNA-binding protein [Hymenobacter sediminis]|uniref:helix-turn-helix domain-containing protein n=1 Tax=Hymenobacter sediminis TaxID=2218621 RepID=UPI000DA645F5|nr:helix-turn-helix domain-containing protein [Hymenobacter sediminis]RPD50157.1 DNA-binding protein [Hymenobacter sediminis]